MSNLLSELEAQSKWLRKAAAEIATYGYNGWGNTCLQAADVIDTHHAEIAAAVMDAAYGRALREAMEAEYQAAKESRKGGKQEAWITTYCLLRRLKVAADYLADAAMSAREGE